MLENVANTGLLGLGWLLFALATAGFVYGLATVFAFVRFFGTLEPPGRRHEAVTILKPLCGSEPRLAENLRTFVTQDHDAPVQILCGFARADDGAAAAVSSLRSEFPAVDLTAVVSARRHGPSAKVSNLVNLVAEAKHPIVILSDSDMSVDRDYLAHVLQALDDDRVGAVSLLYRGRGDAGFWSRLAAAGISYQFLPNAVFGIWSGLAVPCMGSTIAIRRELLEHIGSLHAFAGHLADDHAIGKAVARAGLAVRVPGIVITHACAERSFAELWRHEVRWGATVRGVEPLCYVGSVITHSLPLAILGTLATRQFGIGCSLVVASLAVRTLQVALVDRQVGQRTSFLWLLPVRDGLSFAVFVASLFARRVDWRGSRHDIHRHGRLAIDQEYPA